MLKRILHWLTHQTICAWCNPQRRLGGNPLALNISHGMCERCAARKVAEALALNSQPSTLN